MKAIEFPLPTLILASLAVFGGNAQAPAVRTETGPVVVDALVRDKTGKPVSGLGAKDFRLFEDGKEQTIASFAPNGVGGAGQPGPVYVAFLFDAAGYAFMGRAAAEESAGRDAANFAGAYAGPNRYLAVMNLDVNGVLSTAQGFTTAAERVQRAAGDVPRAVIERGVPRRLPARWPSVDAIRTIANSMAVLKGRRLLVVFGAPYWAGWRGAPPPLETDCNRAKVSVYTTDPDLQSLAEATGGRLIGKDVAGELGEISGELDKGYALSFKPSDPPDGNCHTLRVGVETKGFEVEARNAYCTEKAQDLLAGRAEGAAIEASAAVPMAGKIAASMELPYFYSSPGIALVDLTMDLDLQSLKFTKQKNGRQHAELDLVGQAYGADGGVAARFSDAVPLDFDTPAEAGAVRDYPYRYERQFRLPVGRYRVRVALGSGGESFGKAEAPLTIDPWDGKGFAVSAIALTNDARKIADLTGELDPSLIEGPKDLIAKSIQVIPSGSNNFRDSDPCAGYLEIQDPLMAGPNPPGYDVAVRVLDRRTGEEKAAGGFVAADYIRPGIPVAPVLIDVPIAGLARGSYALEVKVSRLPESAAVVRTVDFQIDEGDAEAAGGNTATSKELESALPPLTPAEAPGLLPGSATPAGSEQERLLAAARQAALDYASLLPNFLCTETVRRTADHGRGFAPVDTLTVEVGYYEGEDRYRLTEVNRTPVHTQYGDTRGTISRGEFGSNLRKIFDPASAADFRFERWTTLDGRPAAAYAYRVERSKAHYQIEAAEGDKLFRGLVGLRGEAIIDRQTFGVLRLNYRADDILPGFPVRRTNITVDYGDAKIGDKVYPLPLKATVELQDKLGTSRNEVTFHSYRQFSSESSLSFGEEAPKQQP